MDRCEEVLRLNRVTQAFCGSVLLESASDDHLMYSLSYPPYNGG